MYDSGYDVDCEQDKIRNAAINELEQILLERFNAKDEIEGEKYTGREARAIIQAIAKGLHYDGKYATKEDKIRTAAINEYVYELFKEIIDNEDRHVYSLFELLDKINTEIPDVITYRRFRLRVIIESVAEDLKQRD